MSKKLLAALLAVCMVAGLLFVPAAAASTFTDVGEDHWASGAIERWAGYDVLTGHGDGTFTPDVAMTRAEFASMLVNMLGLTAKSDKAFDDVDADAWYAEVISIAVKAGIITGRGNNKFEPNEPVSFEEAVVMMCRAFGLAKTTEGTDWSKESVEKLTSLGMIGEGADEHLQVGVDCSRAVVAALASAVVTEYVDEDRAEPITGEIPGVVLVVKGAKAEIKDATLAAPVVAESAQVTLTNTKADAVIVSGKDAAVAADEASSVASVTLAGEAPKADIKGEVGSVTIAEETTGAEVEAPKAAEDAIVNNSTESATVNGGTVEGKPVEPTEPTEPDNGEYNGSVSGGGDPYVKPDNSPSNNGGEAATDTRKPTNVPDNPTITENDTLEAGEGKTLCGPENDEHKTHSWTKDVTKNPTCKEAGTVKYTCSNCGATKTENLAKLAHDFDNGRTSYDADKHYTLCKYCDTKKVDAGEAHTLTYTNNQDGTHAKRCACGYVVSEPHTADNTKTTYSGDDCTVGITKNTICQHCKATTRTPLEKTQAHDWASEAVGAKCNNEGCKQTKPAAAGPDEPDPDTHTCTEFTWAFNSTTGVCTGTCKVTAAGTVHTVGAGDPKDGTKTHTHSPGQKGECGNTYYQTEGAWYATNPATCTHDGVNKETGGKCTTCGTTVSACTHTTTTVKANSCTSSDGGTTYTHTTVCSNCNKETTGVSCSNASCLGRSASGGPR